MHDKYAISYCEKTLFHPFNYIFFNLKLVHLLLMFFAYTYLWLDNVQLYKLFPKKRTGMIGCSQWYTIFCKRCKQYLCPNYIWLDSPWKKDPALWLTSTWFLICDMLWMSILSHGHMLASMRNAYQYDICHKKCILGMYSYKWISITFFIIINAYFPLVRHCHKKHSQWKQVAWHF